MPTKIEKDAVTGHEHDRPRVGRHQGAEHAAAELVGLCASTPRIVVGRLVRAVSVVAGRHRLFPRRARLLAAHGSERRGARRSRRSVPARSTRSRPVVRRDPQGSSTLAVARRRAHRLRRPTACRAMARAAAGSPASPHWPPTTGCGAAARANPADHPVWHPQRRRQGARQPDAAVRRRWHPEARRDPARHRLCR